VRDRRDRRADDRHRRGTPVAALVAFMLGGLVVSIAT